MKRIGALVLFVVVTLLAVIFNARIGPDFWPLDSSRVGPNLIASAITWVTILILTVLIYPPLRRRVGRYIDKRFDEVHKRLEKQRDHNEWMAKHLARHLQSHGTEVDPHPHFDIGNEKDDDNTGTDTT